MSHAALTAKYRPQTFAQVAGQETIKTILSRAALEGRVAAAYLFSGTRGVGKTTLARIFAKALNCRTAPTAEPCNQCDQCRAVTAGNAVDVVEIDGASNRGIDDVRRLKEVVGYAPMEGAYKIFIIDEAHMLSREAFNALLKTLEEPPARVTFIMATTEPHKFPATIISRCQHYVCKRLPESGLSDHLRAVLNREGVDYEESALRLIARRGAGSVRDCMSLLGQVLALGEGKLTENAARGVLGLAGQEAFMRLLGAFKTGDAARISALLRDMLDQGLDMGFFLRELASLWRNLFMLRQSGEAALPVVELPENEARACLEASQDFSLQHIHACWQMTLEGQRRVLTSLEPALALELLLLNIAMLPKLLSLESLSAMGRKGAPPAPATPPGPPAPVSSSGASGPEGVPHTPSGRTASAAQKPQACARAAQEPEDGGTFSRMPEAMPATPGPRSAPLPTLVTESAPEAVPAIAEPHGTVEDLPAEHACEAPCHDAPGLPAPWVDNEPDDATPRSSRNDAAAGEESACAPDRETKELPGWEEVLRLCGERDTSAWMMGLLRRVRAEAHGQGLLLLARDEFTAERLSEPEARELLRELFLAACGVAPDIEIRAAANKRKTRDALHAEVTGHPLVRSAETHLGARVIDYGQFR